MLADNLFEELPPVAWRQHGRIRSLDLSGNHLGPVLDLGQAPWPELETLQLSGNDIAQVLGMASDLLPELRTLDLSDNRIEPWPLDDAPFERLEQLNLAGNELNELPSALLELEDLEILDLGDNRLGRRAAKIGSVTCRYASWGLATNKSRRADRTRDQCTRYRQHRRPG